MSTMQCSLWASFTVDAREGAERQISLSAEQKHTKNLKVVIDGVLGTAEQCSNAIMFESLQAKAKNDC
jgi:hypothetical protein